MTSRSMLEVEQLSVQHGKTPVLEAVDLAVAEGAYAVLLGPSGCGKSTLLHVIAGLLAPSSGVVRIAGRDCANMGPAERGIAMVFQSYALYPTMTVRRNLSFALEVAGATTAEIHRRVDRAVELLQLGSFLERKPSALSGGQRQRVAIGRALVREAQLYLLDEPLSNLDAQMRGELRRELQSLHRRLGATMLHVTHDQTEAMALGTHLAIMRSGRIEQFGSPRELYESPLSVFAGEFLGSPPMNFFPGVLREFDGCLSFFPDGGDSRAVVLRKRVSGRTPSKVVLGVRPEHMLLVPEGGWRGRVRMVEPLGAQRVLWVEFGDLTVSLLVAPSLSLSHDVVVGVWPDPSKVALFSAEDGRRLQLEGEECA